MTCTCGHEEDEHYSVGNGKRSACIYKDCPCTGYNSLTADELADLYELFADWEAKGFDDGR